MLDFDGVINQFSSTTVIDSHLVRRVAKLVKETDAQVVLSTAWRQQFSLLYLKALLHRYGFNPQCIIGATPILPDKPRGQEIDAWLRKSGKTARVAVLDDNDGGVFDMGPVRQHLVRTNPMHGLTREDRQAAHRLLMDGPVWSAKNSVWSTKI